jgi:hypothetical protein
MHINKIDKVTGNKVIRGIRRKRKGRMRRIMR